MVKEKINLEHIKFLAKIYSWIQVAHDRNIYMISFKRKKARVNIYYSKMTVATAITHPSAGKTQLYRKNVSEAELEKILSNPRQHTGKGYFRKKSKYFKK